MKKQWVFCPVRMELIPKDEYYAQKAAGPLIMPDIAGYKSMQTGEWISSRSQHREHLKRHGLVEVGNEIASHMAPVRRDDRKERESRKRLIADVMNSKGY